MAPHRSHTLLNARADAHVLTLASGGGVLPLMAAATSARLVTGVERSHMLYRMARQVLAANASAPGADRVQLIGRRLQAIGIEGAHRHHTSLILSACS